MHCPRCGSDALSGQQFCRSCGLNLEKVTELLAEQPATVGNSNLARLHDRQQKLERWAGMAGLGTFGVILLTLLYVVIYQMILKGMIVPGLLLIVLSIGAAVMAVLQVYAKSLKQELARGQHALALDPAQPEPINQLAAPPAQSVTEHTTELLPAVNREPRTVNREL
jgi:hypothetical protein